MSRLKKGKSLPASHMGTADKPASEAIIGTANEIQLLKREIEFLGIHHNRRTSSLEQDIKYLQEENFALCRKLDWYQTQHQANISGSCTSDEVKELSAELERRNTEIEEKIRQVSSLEEQLNTAEGLSAVLKDSQSANNVSAIFSKELAQLESTMSQAALLLAQCISDKQVSNIRKSPRRCPELDAIIRSSLGKMNILASHPKIAFSALLFGFTRERVFYSSCWTALQLEGYMLRGYQAVIQRISKSREIYNPS
jgi:DNA repair exonuclease SbcCD ATPase subunit